ncbi:CaiB/BaiF CoA transferase family protein [Sinorhizobium fredii]|uniref:CaiB/BaiF CoA transferase family protein n=1 Tax=Rhizobium fredii TaxID=380 RepID=UPI000694A261|nr:CoA transferase [Sinorhizobium fredii]WOS65486.1 CoA transferase [Sinorhizobium fredii GR64]
MTPNLHGGLLAGLVVVELGHRTAARACGGLFTDLGADVIVLEPANRHAEGPAELTLSVGKTRLTVDWTDDGQRADAGHILETADAVLISSDLCREDARIWSAPRPRGQVVCDFTAYGHTGPLAGLPHGEALVQAMAATADTTGNRNGPPVFTGAPYLDMETAAYGFSAILAALAEKDRSGLGQRIDMALYDVGVNALLTFIPLAQTGREATRAGNRHPTLAPWNAFRANDGWVLICSPTNDQWRRLCIAIERPEIERDPRFISPTLRFENVDALDAIIDEWVGSRTVAECTARVGGQGIPCSPIVELGDLQFEPNLRHRQAIISVKTPGTGRDMFVPASPIRIAGKARMDKAVSAASPVSSYALPRARVPIAGSVDGDPTIPGLPLAGIRVIEIGMNTVAPLACRQLGALGADVIKVEPPAGDVNRVNTPIREDGESYIFALSNTDKRGEIFDLKDAGDAARLWEVIATADVVIENLKPGSLGKLGFGASDILSRFPRMIYCSVNGFGYDSAYPGRPALDTVVQAMSGAMGTTIVDGVPTKAGISISDQLGGQFGLAAILAGLHARRHGGSGLHFDIAMQDCSAWATQARWNGAAPVETRACILRTADGYVAAECEEAQLRSVWDGRSAGELTSRDLIAVLEKTGIAAAPIQTVADVLVHPHTRARGLLRKVPTIDGREWTVLGCPLKLLSSDVRTRLAMPALGFPDTSLIEEFGWHGHAARRPQFAQAGE